ncbi:hypothetical protein JA33_197 [Dickeya phage vB_DsoM_JA33]|uniref:Uncharacterized protein n=3 Tax=Salmondvirus JA11 TaxID=2734141 RepID=A0A384ZWH5_9CAUD|nr:hypothetical protein HOU32_gp197 [Dickeya phage vB_DsoM_JA11]AXG66600.1 hypothetical protein JA13_197 [Dickeya phage vB_DsoM_JA13]AXG67571.1 hypothetical protein JA33_197 [Dickeya phage vB_DsoM_JA33]AYD80002.1 hypothetical protein JA11_197 [Dickeya phage vB_DsoM_JA11]
MSDLTIEQLNPVQRSILNVIETSMNYSKSIRQITAPKGFTDWRVISDYCRIAVTVPQRAGVSVLSQFLAEYLLEKFPDANIIRLGKEERVYGDSIEPRIDFIRVETPADYGRARQRIRESEKKYSFVIVDQSEWICGQDNRFEKLSEDMFRVGVDDQYLINLST